MKRFVISFFLPVFAIVLCGSLVMRAAPAFAAPAVADPYGLEGARSQSQYKESKKTLPEIAGSLISVALSVIGLVFLGLALYAGYKWMTAQGNEKDVTVARDTLINATIGIVLIVAAYSITTFIFTDVIGSLTGDGSGATTATTPAAADPAAPAP